ncbi:glycosyltransferase family 2 protein [Flavobacterium acetivorans]|uniref:glycosyltransferase family 2 protein n=1 Tax=Flavobacterium acetivorans TaxID=2893883 RepID=UPI001E646A93|nr:glycosyltransferase family A protein [Flavobacterium sp. F-29]UFH35715.1 glycosyltransferase family 2 protein [Flavobacterium sp. F-29]
MNIPIVSIIVPCYKQAHFLDEALLSVLEQSYPYWECIIVNDGSPDNTAEVAQLWCEKDNRFSYLYKENGGLSSARNAGIKISKGEYILPLDSDDMLHKDYLTKLVPELHTDDSLAIVSCFTQFFSKNITNVVHKLRPYGSTYLNFMFENNLVATSLFRKKCWQQVGGYDESMKRGFEDWEFWIAITKNGQKYKIVEDFLFYYRKSRNSMLMDTLKNHREINMEYVFKKHKKIYIENYDNMISHFFYLLRRQKETELKIKSSIEYKIGKVITKPFKVISKLFLIQK